MLAFYMLYVAIRRRQALLQIKQNRQEIRSLLLRQQELEERNRWLTDKTVRLEAELNLQSVRQLTTSNLLNKEDENVFRQSFAILHPFFLPKLRNEYPRLTRNEELFAMLVCMGQSTDEIALVLGINRSSVNVLRSRMRRNMGLLKEDLLDEKIKQYLP